MKCLSWGTEESSAGDFQSLRSVASGPGIALPGIGEFIRRRTSINIVVEGPDVVLNNNRESVEKSGVKIVASENGVLASFCGRFDIDSSPALRERLLALLQSPHPSVVSIDLSGVNHIDSSGVATLIEALKIARGNGIDLRLQGLHDRLLHLFESTGILSLFNESVRTTRRSGSEAV